MNNSLKVIYILGQPHSGSTIFSYWLSERYNVQYLGEMSYFNKDFRPETLCICEQTLDNCEVWGQMIGNIEITQNSKWNNGFLAGFFRVFRLTNEGKLQEIRMQYLKVLKRLYNSESHSGIFVDSSKSVFFFKLISKIPEIDVELVYLQRNSRDIYKSLIVRPKKYSKFGPFKIFVVILGIVRRNITFSLFFWRWKGNKVKCNFDTLTQLTSVEKIDYFGAQIDSIKQTSKTQGTAHIFSGNRKLITNNNAVLGGETKFQTFLGNLFFS
jgi:hypothetical protein